MRVEGVADTDSAILYGFSGLTEAFEAVVSGQI